MHATHQGPRIVQSDMNVTPLIDVLLVLLVIFILLNLLRLRLVQDVRIPPPAAGEPGVKSAQIVLGLTADGGFAVNRQPVPATELRTYLRQLHANRPSKLLFIQADTARRYHEVIDAMDLARAVGVNGIGLVPARSPQ